MKKIFQECFLGNPDFKLVAIQKSITKILNKQLQRNSFKGISSESINRILEKYLQRNLYFRKLFWIHEQNLWNVPVKELFLWVHHIPAELQLTPIFWITKKWPKWPLETRHRRNMSVICSTIIAYHYLSRNPKFTMEAVN